MQGLLRYDAETFRSLRRVENPSMQVFPSVHVPGETHLQELAVLPGTGTPVSFSSRVRPVDNTLLMKPEPEKWSDILFNITDIGMHRFFFLMSRLPGVAMLMISTWIIWGRGAENHNLFDSEKGMSISAIVVAIVIAVGSIFGAANHNNSKKRAEYQVIYRLIASLLNVLGCTVVLVFSAVAISKLHGAKDDTIEYEKCRANACYSTNERLTFAAVLIGLSFMIIVLSIMSFIQASSGAYKLRSITKKPKQNNGQPENRRRIQAAFNNPAMNAESDYY
uniref:MARVEL domain-containing protein n=1 Tax=Steinernema glaseri TaxID=37863 RepID=A0A1I7YE45_9BILA